MNMESIGIYGKNKGCCMRIGVIFWFNLIGSYVLYEGSILFIEYK